MKTSFLIILALVASGGVGCADEEQNSPAVAVPDSMAVVNTYQGLRGRVEQLADTTGRLYIRHEAIPDFIRPTNEGFIQETLDPGMLPFLIGEGADTTGLAVGDKIAFDLVVDWDTLTLPLPGRLIHIEKLADSTTLVLETP